MLLQIGGPTIVHLLFYINESFPLSIVNRRMGQSSCSIRYTSLGIVTDAALVAEYLASDTIEKPRIADHADPLVKLFNIPLIFEPGEGFAHGNSIHWTQLLVERLRVGGNFVKYSQEHIFDPLSMTSSTYGPRARADIWNRRLRMVERDPNRLKSADTRQRA